MNYTNGLKKKGFKISYDRIAVTRDGYDLIVDINKKVQELSKLTSDDDKNFNKDTLEEIVNYYQLKSLLSKKLNRVI